MSLYRAFLWLWIGGLILFAILIMLGLPLGVTEVPGGILDHQAAGSAAEVDRIQHVWRSAGLWNQAAIAMIGDLIFIGIYGLGSLLGGLHFRRSTMRPVSILGVLISIAAVTFVITDYAETIAQFIQLTRFEGDDGLASLAASVRPVKIASWLVTFFGIIACLVIRRKARRTA